MCFLTLDEYLTGARKIIIAQKRGFLANDDDAVSHVAYRMMLADQTWDGSSSRNTWRYNQAKYAIMRIIAKKTKEKSRGVLSLDYGWDQDDKNTLIEKIPDIDREDIYEQFNSVCNVAKNVLTERQFNCIELYYKDNLSMESVGNKLNISKQMVSLHIKNAIKELKRCILKHN